MAGLPLAKGQPMLADRSRRVSLPPVASLADRLLRVRGSISADVALAIAPVALWVIGGMVDSAPVVTVAHLVIIGLILLRPRAGMLALIPLLPFRHALPFPPHGPILAEAIAIAMAIALRAAWRGVEIPSLARPAVWLAVAFLVATIFQSTLGLRVFDGALPMKVISQLDQIVIIVMVFTGSVVFLGPSGVVPALLAYLAAFVTVAGVGILYFIRPGIVRRLQLEWMISPDATQYRASGVIANANFLGLFVGVGMAALVVLIAWYVRSGRALPALTAMVAASAGVVAMLLTLSRAAILAAGVGVVVTTARASLRAAVALVIAGILIVTIAYPIFLDLRLTRTFGSSGSGGQTALSGSDKLRAGQAVAATQAFLDSPLLGHGFGTFSEISPAYSKQDVLTSAHNAFLKLAAEQGALGLGLFIGFLGAVAVALWRVGIGPWSAGLAVLGVLGAFSLTGDTLTSAQATAPAFVLLALALIAAEHRLDPFEDRRADLDGDPSGPA